jgi:fucose permease
VVGAGRLAVHDPARLALLCLILPLPALCSSAPPALALTLLLGAAMGTLDVSMNAHGVAVERRRPRPILSSLHAGFSFGALLGAGVGAAAAAVSLDVRAHLALVAGVSAVVGAIACRGLLPAGTDAETGAPARVRAPPRRLWALGAIGFACLLAEGAAGDWSAVYVKDSLGGTPAVAALAFGAFSVTMTLGRLVGDRLTERWGGERLLRGGGLLGATGLGMALVMATPWAALAGFLLLGAGLAAMVPTVFRGAGAVEGLPPGVALAAVSTLGYTGLLAGPPVIGVVAELTSLPLALGLVCVCCAAVVVLAPSVHSAQNAATSSRPPLRARFRRA